MQHANWICQSQWVDPSLAPQFSPVKLIGEEVGDGIIVRWSENYTARKRFYQENTATKENYLHQLRGLLTNLQTLIQEILRLTNSLEASIIAEEEYEDRMKQLEPQVTAVYLRSSEMELAPYECQQVNSSFKSAIAFAHNIVLPFSVRGQKTWNNKQRRHFVVDAIDNYQKEMRRLEMLIETLR
ncbi:hypothetical protein OSCT_1832 [Oscillochloris trichoides DG-6]|uniref:Uncharacterized protein n=1 Tax=Oscillochloris trichoides DG-6 TaxID=765420 RepID=E1IET1_9CHLR|nr:hypothetical protein OSCT_1832 [Oscillochloris trichoides DG-6]